MRRTSNRQMATLPDPFQLYNVHTASVLNSDRGSGCARLMVPSVSGVIASVAVLDLCLRFRVP